MRPSSHRLNRRTINPSLPSLIIDRHMRIVPSQARLGTEALCQVHHAFLGKPGFRRCPAVPEIDAAGARFSVQIVLAAWFKIGDIWVTRTRWSGRVLKPDLDRQVVVCGRLTGLS